MNYVRNYYKYLYLFLIEVVNLFVVVYESVYLEMKGNFLYFESIVFIRVMDKIFYCWFIGIKLNLNLEGYFVFLKLFIRY